MEITNKQKESPNTNQFKIDLIVWKYKEEPRGQSVAEKFKIDLIVWKY